jgi:hypothetical protein
MDIEMTYQIKHTGAKVVLVHPSATKTLAATLKVVDLPKSNVFLFSDTECGEVDGISDWRLMAGTLDDARFWQWEGLTHESKARIATINYSSGYENRHSDPLDRLTNALGQLGFLKASAFPNAI